MNGVKANYFKVRNGGLGVDGALNFVMWDAALLSVSVSPLCLSGECLSEMFTTETLRKTSNQNQTQFFSKITSAMACSVVCAIEMCAVVAPEAS